MNSNQTLVEAALAAISARGFTSTAGECQRWVRQVVQSRYGKQFDGYWRGSAKDTAEVFRNSPYRAHGVPLPGDLLYKTNGQYGHVGIYVGSDLVAENSSTTIGRVSGARGFRTLARYGRIDILVRLPLPAVEAERLVAVPGGGSLHYRLEGGQVFVPLRGMAELLGATVETSDWPVVVVTPRGEGA